MTPTKLHRHRRLAVTLAAALLPAGCGGGSAVDDDAGTEATQETGTSAGTSDSTGPADARSIVLVHGAWMGAWSWDRVVPLLERAGHDVHVVELPAHGEDLTDPGLATLDGYRDAVLATMDDAAGPVVLVAHSMGGMVISAVAEADPERVDALVFVAAYLPQDGQSLLDLAFMDAGSLVGEHLVDNGDGTNSIETDAIGDVFCADCSAADVELLQAQHRPEPVAPLATPVVLGKAFDAVPRYYIHTAADSAVSPGLQDQMAAATPVDGETTLDTAHCPMLTDPSGLADVITGFVP